MKSTTKILSAIFLVFITISFFSCGEDDVNPCDLLVCPDGYLCIDGDCIIDSETTRVVTGEILANTTWTNDKIYQLSNKVIVQSGVTLTIEPGTIIKGEEGEQSLASALIIANGGKIIAEGTSTQPIIFTSVLDDIQIGETVGTNLNASDRGLWGGLILLGKAPVSVSGTDTEGQIEGVPADIPNTTYGGTDATDNSGILRYISIRHGGIRVSDGNEINGLTLGGVGSGTIIENVEVVSNLDDGIECFGGTVNLKNVVIGYCGDDALDLDQNYAGTVDNIIIVQDSDSGETDFALEFDGPEGSTHTTGKFTLMNGSFILNGIADGGADLKSTAQGNIMNCVWEGYNEFIQVRASFNPADCSEKTDSYTRLASDDLVIMNCEAVTETAMMADFAIVYSDDDPGEEDCFNNNYAANYQTVANDKIMQNGNAMVTTATTGANKTVFAWSLTKTKGGF